MPSPKVTLQKSKRLSEPARRLLEKALTAMVRYPETVDMGTFYEHDDDVRATRKLPEPYCGIVACLAGHVVIATRKKLSTGEYSSAALRALGLKRDYSFVGHALFTDYNKATGADYPIEGRAQARAVVSRVKHWIRTGE